MKYTKYPADYQADTNDYKCNICGWQGYPEIPELGWCPTEDIMCPECGPDVTEEYEIEEPKQDLGGYFI